MAAGDTVEVCTYDRLTSLEAEHSPLSSLQRLQPGDCVVVFNRNGCYALKKQIETLHRRKFKCCVIYGALPPAARQEQARLFNTADSGYDILVATDAVGMGLNLSIRRIIFNQLTKFDGKRRRGLRFDEVKQIGGRAGRYQSRYPEGKIACMNEKDLSIVRRALQAKDPHIKSAGLFPSIQELKILEGMS